MTTTFLTSLFLAVLVLLTAPTDASARQVLVDFAWDTTYGNLEFGPDLGYARIVDQPLGPDEHVQLHGRSASFDVVGGTFNLWTGPLLDVTIDGDDAVYTHASGGGVSVLFDLALPDGSVHHGWFDAPLGPYIVYPDSVGGGGETSGLLGEGLFDKRTAHLLHIARRTPYGFASLYLDTYDAYPDTYRVAKSFGYMDLVAVPEPQLSLLYAVALGVAASRRLGRSDRRVKARAALPDAP